METRKIQVVIVEGNLSENIQFTAQELAHRRLNCLAAVNAVRAEGVGIHETRFNCGTHLDGRKIPRRNICADFADGL